MGVTIGSLAGPPIAGILYQRLGFRAPFIFGIIITAIDLLGRLLLIERREAMRWGVDPMGPAPKDEKVPGVPSSDAPAPVSGELQESKQPCPVLLPHAALLKLMKSSRAVACFILMLVWGLGWTAQETVVVLYMNRTWGLDPFWAGIAFIVAVLPTVFCKSQLFPLFLTLVMYPDHLRRSQGSCRSVGRQVWSGPDRLCCPIFFPTMVRVSRHQGPSPNVPHFLWSRM